MFMSIHLLDPMMTKKNLGLNKPHLDYPYLSLPDIDEKSITDSEEENAKHGYGLDQYPLWEQNFEHGIQGLYDR